MGRPRSGKGGADEEMKGIESPVRSCGWRMRQDEYCSSYSRMMSCSLRHTCGFVWCRVRGESLVGKVQEMHGINPPIVLARDLRKEECILLEHAPRRITSVSDLELVTFLKEGEILIGGEELVRRARTELNANYSQEDAEWLLDHQDEIPEEFQNFYLLFTATVWKHYGHRYIPYMDWFEWPGWSLAFTQFDDSNFCSPSRLPRPRVA